MHLKMGVNATMIVFVLAIIAGYCTSGLLKTWLVMRSSAMALPDSRIYWMMYFVAVEIAVCTTLIIGFCRPKKKDQEYRPKPDAPPEEPASPPSLDESESPRSPDEPES